MIGKLKDIYRSRDGEWVVSFTTPEDFRDRFDALSNENVDVTIKKHSKHRSLSANAYAWVLIDQIAEVTKKTVKEVYQTAIREIPGVSDVYGVREAAFDDFKRIWIGDHLGAQVQIIPGSQKPGWINVKAWKGSSDFDSVQMSALIDSLIQEAEQQGIHTIPDKETQKLIEMWGKRVEKPETVSA